MNWGVHSKIKEVKNPPRMYFFYEIPPSPGMYLQSLLHTMQKILNFQLVILFDTL